jgi:hypothetical protein
MKRFTALVLMVLSLGLVGCAKEPTKPPPNKDISVTGPGGLNIKVGEGGVSAPGVNIQVDKGGVDVKAPGVNVTVPK